MTGRNQTKSGKTRASANIPQEQEGAGAITEDQASKVDLAELISEILEKKLNEKLAPLQQSIDNVKETVKDALDQLQRLDNLEEEVSDLKSELKIVNYEKKYVKTENDMLKKKIIMLERSLKKNNIKLFGLKEKKGENLLAEVLKLLSAEGLSLHPRSIAAVYRIGYQKKSFNRPIIIQVLYYEDKASILKLKKNLKKKDIRIGEDYPYEIYRRRKVLLPIFFEALENHPQCKPKLLTDSILLNGVEYDVENITTVPIPELHPEKIFTRQHMGVTAYFTRYSPFSNHFPCNFETDDMKFKSVEQYYMYHMAMHCEDRQLADESMMEVDAGINKQQSKLISNFKSDAWDLVKADIMYRGMFLKFSQNKELKTVLLDTGANTLCEANPSDSVWGVALPLSNKDVFHPDKWKGENLAGKTLERVREYLK